MKSFQLSRALYDRAEIIPGRSVTRSKAPGALYGEGDGPLYCVHGSGPYIYDVDGNPYIDMLCALGAVSLGYFPNPPANVYSLPHEAEVFAAEAVLKHVAPWASHVRFVKTGSEATHAAYRIAKAATGRDCVLMGDWAYHGWHEWCSKEKLKTGDGFRPIMPTTVMYPHSVDWDAYPNCMPGHFAPPNRIAAVFVEPHRWEPVDLVWLWKTRNFCDRIGALLVFDEMIYGGRWALGGATEYFGVKPDIACYGKALGNGAPIAFVVGRDHVRDHGDVVSGTYGGEIGGLNALIKTIDAYKIGNPLDRIWTTGSTLMERLRELVNETGWCDGAVVEGNPPHMRLRFRDEENGRRFSVSMAQNGVLWHPACVNVSACLTLDNVGRVLEAAKISLETL